jgi:glycosyltransferase involved in cell wall biosynthesis
MITMIDQIQLQQTTPFAERLLASGNDDFKKEPFITIAIPHYKRRRYLEINLASLFEQRFTDFEILISDDNSPDDSNDVIPLLLQKSGRLYRYYAQPSNLGYDGNVRFCLGAAHGRYVMMLGNDDALVSPTTLLDIADVLRRLNFPEVAITNYEDWESHAITRRAYGVKVLGAGPHTAIHYFRSFSFTSGLIYDRIAAAKHETARWDRSIYYQIFLACRIIAAGGRLGALDVRAVRDHIRLDGELVPETYRNRFKNAPLSFAWRHTGLDSVVRVTVDAVLPFISKSEQSASIRRIFTQVLTITYPYWLFEYRQLANWGFAFGIARDLWPSSRLAEYKLKLGDRLYLWMLYLLVTFAGLTIPARLFNNFRARIADFVRHRRQLSTEKHFSNE